MISKPALLVESLRRREPGREIVCMMCVRDEAMTVMGALASSMDLVTRYVVIDKNGGTIPTVKAFSDLYGLEVDYHVKPSLGLRDSRLYALGLIEEPWIMIVDGDEIILNHGLIRARLGMVNTYLRSRKRIILGDGSTPPLNSGYHSFIYHNNGTLRLSPKEARDPRIRDIPIMDGRGILLGPVCILNLHFKDLV